MTQEEIDVLLKDLCARLPYGIKVQYENEVFDIDNISPLYEEIKLDIANNYTISILEIKPYLFPLSSMTLEQRYELHDLIHNLNVLVINGEIGDWIVSSSEIDWYNKNHFDYRGLIEKGLAIDATGLNVY